MATDAVPDVRSAAMVYAVPAIPANVAESRDASPAMMGNLPDQFWKPVVAKRFEESERSWDLTGLEGDTDEIYRFTIRHNNMSGRRDCIRINVNGDYRDDRYDAIESYMSTDYRFGDRKIFTGLSMISSTFEDVWQRSREAVPDWKGWEVLHPNWRVIREPELGYLTFGMPKSGVNALFGHGLLFASSGGPRSLVRTCTEQHPNGNLLTLGRYTYTESDTEITELNFSSKHEDGLGEDSFVVVERLDFPDGDAVET